MADRAKTSFPSGGERYLVDGVMGGELAKQIEFAQSLLDAAIDVVGGAQLEITEEEARDPKVIGITILCRSISNFRAALLLVQQQQVLEARVLLRIMYENLLWLAALRERGADFVADMVADEAFNRRALAQLALEVTSRHGGDLDSDGALALRSIIKEIGKRHPKPNKLSARDTAGIGVVESAYLAYSRFSLDAVHCSVTALGRHLTREAVGGARELVVNVMPAISDSEVRSTVLFACRALMGAAIGANELVGFTPVSKRLSELVNSFEANGWVGEE